ncbi:hypothetical protein PHYSODRAFT_376475, partial [Phytophthora sojae]
KNADDFVDVQSRGKVNKRRMECVGQPISGWEVSITQRTCPCRASYKYGNCAHLVVALKTR